MKQLKDLYFGVRRYRFGEHGLPEVVNLFDYTRVLSSIALWKTRKDLAEQYSTVDDVIRWCFSDVHYRAEWEMVVGPLFDESCTRVDAYEMYVLPNKELLYNMINEVSVRSCREYLKEERARRKQ